MKTVAYPAIKPKFLILLAACASIALTGCSEAQKGAAASTFLPTAGARNPLASLELLASGQRTITLEAANKDFLVAQNGGGMGGANCGPTDLALHTNATRIGPWEKFRVHQLGSNYLALETSGHYYVTASGGGGIGGSGQPIVTNGTFGQSYEEFTLVPLSKPHMYAIRTANGVNYVTAVNGGGCGDNDPENNYPIHTNAKTIGPDESFYAS